MNQKTDYIAVFDSGVGGISVLRHLCRLMPGERFLYFGDSANAPYGSRPEEEIRNLTLAAVRRLVSRGIKALVVACNTATSAAIEDLRREYPDLIVVGIEPALKPAVDHHPGGTIGVMATEATLRQRKFMTLMTRLSENCHVVMLPVPGLVKLVETGLAESEETKTLLEPVLTPWKGKLDALVLGCTHYPFASETIAELVGEGTELLDGGEGTARETLARLSQRNLLERGEGQVVLENSLGSREIMELSASLLQQ